MKTLNRQKSEKLFYKIKELGSGVSFLSAVVQNPDFVNEENAQENYEAFYNSYKRILDKLKDIREEVFQLHEEVLSK